VTSQKERISQLTIVKCVSVVSMKCLCLSNPIRWHIEARVSSWDEIKNSVALKKNWAIDRRWHMGACTSKSSHFDVVKRWQKSTRGQEIDHRPRSSGRGPKISSCQQYEDKNCEAMRRYCLTKLARSKSVFSCHGFGLFH
jgi:hypothetical protein